MDTPSLIERFARGVSLVFHPLVVVIPTMIVAMVATGSSLLAALLWTALAVLLVNLPMAGLILYGMRSGRYSDASVSMREQRGSIYLVGGLCLIVLLAAIVAARGPQIQAACLIAAVLTTLIGAFINRFTKISLHAAAIAGCAAALLWAAPSWGAALTAMLPLVGWSRIVLKHHTWFQILLGWIVPMICVAVVFRLVL